MPAPSPTSTAHTFDASPNLEIFFCFPGLGRAWACRSITYTGGRAKNRHYAFDRVFDVGDGQATVYNSTARYLIPSVLDGYNATVFAYGQTGAGKVRQCLGPTIACGAFFQCCGPRQEWFTF